MDDVAASELASVGAVIRAQRKALGLRIDDAAAKCGVSVALLSALENGSRPVKLDKLICVIRELGMKLVIAPWAEKAVDRIRKFSHLELSFPYDWSNGDISEDALIINVLERGIFSDICRICAHFGVENVERVRARLPINNASLDRMLSNIKKGFDRAQSE